MRLNGISERTVIRFGAWVEYSYDTIPASVHPEDLNELALLSRWWRKSRKFCNQSEYRLGWIIRSPQLPTPPNEIFVELTKTGLSLFEPWDPPSE